MEAPSHTLRDILSQNGVKQAAGDARSIGANAAEVLAMSGKEGDIVILALGKNKKIHVKDYGRGNGRT